MFIVRGLFFLIAAKEKFEIVKSCGEAAPNSGGLSRRNAFGLIQEYCTDVITVTRTGTNDTTPPTVNILVPTSNPTATTTQSTVTLSSLIKDDRAIATSTALWTNAATGASGTVIPTIYGWAAINIPLAIGTNQLTVSVQDSSGNIGTDVITVTRIGTFAALPLFPSPAISPPQRQINTTALASILEAVGVLLEQLRQLIGEQ